MEATVLYVYGYKASEKRRFGLHPYELASVYFAELHATLAQLKQMGYNAFSVKSKPLPWGQYRTVNQSQQPPGSNL
jgi:hypothetical protein